MSDGNGDSKPRMMPHIPFEILQQIALYLPDISTARNLSLSCKALRDCGEAGCWAVLDLTSGWDQESQLASARPISDADWRARGATVDSKARHALAAFEAYPLRLDLISTLRIEPSDGGPGYPRARSLIKILKLVAPRLKRLAILPLPWNDSASLDSPASITEGEINRPEFFTLLRRVDLPILVHLQIAILQRGPFALVDWMLTHLVNLRTLELCSTTGLLEDAPLPTSTSSKKLRYLESLTVTHMWDDLESSRTLEALLYIAPQLRDLRVRGNWCPSKGNFALSAMRNLSMLNRVVLVPGQFHEVRGQASVHIMEFGRYTLGVTEAAVGDRFLEELRELDIDYELSRISTLERLTILTGPSLPASDYAALSIDPSGITTYEIFPSTMRQLRGAPAITTILLLYLETPSPLTYKHDFVEPDYFMSPIRWVAEGHRGCIVRQYYDQADSQAFTHLRVLTRVMYHPDGDRYIGARRSWKDLTRFQGQTVPRDVLEMVYRELGEGSEFLEGGRGMELPDKAWQILRDWRQTLGPSEDDSDSEESESEDDSQEQESEDEDNEGDDGINAYYNDHDEYEDDYGDSDESEDGYDGSPMNPWND